MKIQTYGVYKDYTDVIPDCISMRADVFENGSIKDYRKKRLNGNEKDDVPPTPLPEDGEHTLVHGYRRGNWIHPVEVANHRHFRFEVRYDEGEGDKRWMAWCDLLYLARLYLLGASTPEEQRDLIENKDRAAKSADVVAKLPIEQLSVALRYHRELPPKVRKVIYDSTPLPNELIAIVINYWNGPVGLLLMTCSPKNSPTKSINPW